MPAVGEKNIFHSHNSQVPPRPVKNISPSPLTRSPWQPNQYALGPLIPTLDQQPGIELLALAVPQVGVVGGNPNDPFGDSGALSPLGMANPLALCLAAAYLVVEEVMKVRTKAVGSCSQGPYRCLPPTRFLANKANGWPPLVPEPSRWTSRGKRTFGQKGEGRDQEGCN